MDVKFEIKGEKELFKNLRILDTDLQAKTLIQSARAALRALQKDAQSRVKTDTGLLQKSIQYDTKIYDGGSVLYGVVGINSKVKGVDKKGAKRSPIRYAHIVEYYTSFFRKTWESKKNELQNIFEKSIQRKLNAALKKLNIKL